MQINNIQWGVYTPDGYDYDNSESLQVYNVKVNEQNASLIIDVIVSRSIFADQHLPVNSKQKILMDLRGQNLSQKICDDLKNRIISTLNQTLNSKVSIEILK